MELQAKGQGIEFGKNGQNEWQIVKPRPLRADSSAVQGLVDKLRDAKFDNTESAEDAVKKFAGAAKTYGDSSAGAADKFHNALQQLQITVGTALLPALNRLMEQGKVREIGCSTFSAEQLQEAHGVASARGLRGFACVQNEYNLLAVQAQRDVLAACEALGVALVPYFPLAMGLLTGKYRRGQPLPTQTRLTATDDSEDQAFVEARLAAVGRLAGYAERHGHTLLELALGWLASQDRVASVIAGAMTATPVRENVTATSSWHLTAGEMAEVERLATDTHAHES